jgi:F-type H+-transporting ATPase subunit delta
MKSSLVASEIAEPYAQALMSLAQSSNTVDQIGDDMRSLADLLKSSNDFRTCLESPVIKPAAKKELIGRVLTDQVHPNVVNFLYVLVDRGRISFITTVCQQFQALLRKLKQTVLAEVTSAIELTEEQRNAVCDRVRTMTSAQQVDIETTIDPGLIGGVIIKVGSQVIDASLKGQLRRMGVRLGSSV